MGISSHGVHDGHEGGGLEADGRDQTADGRSQMADGIGVVEKWSDGQTPNRVTAWLSLLSSVKDFSQKETKVRKVWGSEREC